MVSCVVVGPVWGGVSGVLGSVVVLCGAILGV